MDLYVYMDRLREAAVFYRNEGFNTDPRRAAEKAGLPLPDAGQEEIIDAIRKMASPGMLNYRYTYEEWKLLVAACQALVNLGVDDSRLITSE